MNQDPSAAEQPARKVRQVRIGDVRQRYPAVFGQPFKPLRIGVHEDLQVELGPKAKYFLAHHTNTPDYLKALARGGARYRLDGTPDGEVDEKARLHALARLQKHWDDLQAVWDRAKLRRAIDASGSTPEAFASGNQLDPVATRASYDKAVHERAVRRVEREKLVSDYEASGLSPADFAKRQKLRLTRLERAIQKVRGVPGAESA
jgi:sRNA-binding protein